MADGAEGVVGGAGVRSSVADRHVAQVHVAHHLPKGGPEAAHVCPAVERRVGEGEGESFVKSVSFMLKYLILMPE